MVQKQEAAIPDLSGLGSQLGDLDKKLVKDLEIVPDKIATMRRYAGPHDTPQWFSETTLKYCQPCQ